MNRTEQIAEYHRVPWIKTVVMVSGSDAMRAAFIAGYNNERRPPKPATSAKWKAWELGQTVRGFLCDSVSGPEGENSRSEVEGEAPQSGLSEDSGIAHPPLPSEQP